MLCFGLYTFEITVSAREQRVKSRWYIERSRRPFTHSALSLKSYHKKLITKGILVSTYFDHSHMDATHKTNQYILDFIWSIDISNQSLSGHNGVLSNSLKHDIKCNATTTVNYGYTYEWKNCYILAGDNSMNLTQWFKRVLINFTTARPRAYRNVLKTNSHNGVTICLCNVTMHLKIELLRI